MAKQLLEINKFQNGTVTTPDSTDTPEQSATFSINLDCVNKDGALQGAPINAGVTIKDSVASENAASPDIDKARVLRLLADDGTVKEDVVYFENANDKLHLISNLEKADSSTRLNHTINSSVFPAGGKEYSSVDLKDVAMETHNKEVHIGLGQLNNPQWVGYTNHKGLVDEAKILVAEDAEVKYPSSIPYMHKMVLGSTADSYFYGIRHGGTRIWKIDGSAHADGGTRVSSSTKGTFNNLQSIASDPANGRLYVLDKQSNGYVHEVSIDDLDEKDVTYTLPGTYPGPASSWYSDIQYTSGDSGKIWLAAHYNSRTGTASPSSNFIWNFTRSGSSISPTLVSRMPRMTGGDENTIGTWVEWVWEDDPTPIAADEASETDTYIAETFPISLLKHPSDNDAVYWLARYPNSETDSEMTWNKRWLYRATSNITGTGVENRINSVSAIRTLCLHRIKDDNTAGTDFVPLYHVYHPHGAELDDNSFSAVNIDSIGIDNDGDEVYLTIADKIEKLSTNIDTSWTTAETGSPYNKYNLVSQNATGPTTSTTYNVTPTGQSARTGVSINFGYVPSTASAGGTTYAAHTTDIVLARQTSTAGFDKVAQTFANTSAQTFFIDHSVLGLTVTDHASDTGELLDGYTYFYKTTMIYDGYQETPLSMETVFDADHTDTKNNTIVVKINDYAQIPKRASGVKVYRAESDSATSTSPSSVYRLVKVIPFSKAWTVAGITYTYEFDDSGIKGASFEAEAGLAETLEATLPRYSLSTQLNNQHYIGKCWHEGYVKDATSYIFVSKIGKFDVFDWLVDFIKLPTVPTALTSFAGRIYAFDELNTYRIRGGQELFIEDAFEGVGCLNDDAVVSTDFGMFFADNKNIYMHNGNSAEPIGEAIVRGDSIYSWQNRDTSYYTRAMYDATRRSVYFTFKAGSNYYAWAWNIPRKRWDMLSFGDSEGTTQPKGFYILNDTSLNVGTGTAVTKFLGGSTKRLWSWVSKDLTMGNDTQQKSIKQILLPTRVKSNYSTNSTKPSAGSQVGATLTRGTYRQAVNVKATNLKVRLDSNTAGDECGAVGVLFRTKRSPR